MRSVVAASLVASAVAVVGLDVSDAQAAKKKKAPPPKTDLVLSPNPVVLLDVKTGKVLYHKDANRRWYPASLTKLMTAYVAFRAIKAGQLHQDSVLEISPHALSYPPSKMGFKVGTRLTVSNALKMVVVKSANDISAALAERIAGSEAEFAALMNKTAQQLGMTNTHFVNANGLYKQAQVTSARDMAILARQILLEFPQHRGLFQIPAIRHGKRVLRSYNKLLEHFRGADGMKTGFVCASGFNIVASATRNGRQLVAVVLGAPTTQVRAETAAYLLTQGFTQANMGSGAGMYIKDSALFGAVQEPLNMRPQVCTKGSNPKWIAKANLRVSYLDQRFKVMDPVRVYAGVKKSNKRVVLPVSLPVLPVSAPLAKQSKGVKAMKAVYRKSDLNALPKRKP